MSGAWRLLLGAVIALVVGVTLAAEVHRWIIRSGTTVAAGVLLDRYQGGLGLAVERVSAAAPEARAAAAAELSAYFGCPVRLEAVDGMLPQVALTGGTTFTVALRDDPRALIIGPIAAPDGVTDMDRSGVALLVVIGVMLLTAVALVVPIASQLHRLERAVVALLPEQEGVRPTGTPIEQLSASVRGLTAENRRLRAALRDDEA
jgi:hypothetical protein